MLDLRSFIDASTISQFKERSEPTRTQFFENLTNSVDDTTLPPDPRARLAWVAFQALGPEGSPGLPLIQRRSKRDGQTFGRIDELISTLCPQAGRPEFLALKAGLLQMVDDWDASHEAAQAADDLGERQTAAYWHGIAHRREPDPGNAGYWFRRVGRHAAFEPLADEARLILGESKLSTPRLFRGDSWDPIAFIAFCTSARPGSVEDIAARRIQRAEMRILLGISASAAGMGNG